MERHAVTVLGPVPGNQLGITLPHEHLLLDFSCRYSPAHDETEVGSLPAIGERWRLLARPAGYLANLDGTDIESAVAECDHFVRAGGGTIVDLTGEGLGADPIGLKHIAERTGLHVIASTGLYIESSLPAWVREGSVEEIADRLEDDIATGGAEGVPRGAIGEIGIEGVPTPSDFEMKLVRAAARAQARTGAPCFLHVMSGILPETRTGIVNVVDTYVAEGGDISRLVMCHQDGSGSDFAYQEQMLRRGLWFVYDTFGFESVFAFGDRYIQLPTDSQRINEVATLIEAGFGEQLLISQDICYQMMKRNWGGWGYAHILDVLRPRFAAAGVDETMLMTLMVDNPRRLLCFAWRGQYPPVR
jgi:phosphotriesterase-related protein